ncbi:glycoside hydrolase superfamily [Cantharellus anzutake]|uniref:glycoside hydrolase superfamily n=1 Tax=Cantharellus anzutake TaxID=1750568 RepID=UPI001904C812|nr:glycoside hydrolase superfamily [Cantharellus anzutake]KAF8325854.1 glycoside hydrolase superfamily [Cantharellus anzutake]
MDILSDDLRARSFRLLDVEKTLSQLTVAQKISILSGSDMWHTTPITRFGIPSLRSTPFHLNLEPYFTHRTSISDFLMDLMEFVAQNSLKLASRREGVPASCFPVGTGLGASWDRTLLYIVGKTLAVESKAKGAHVLLGPTVNIQRSPLGGRGFESYSEDPFLSGSLARVFIEGVQREGVAATIKHYAANDQEFERASMSCKFIIIASPLPRLTPQGTKSAVGHNDGYNRVNGVHCSENPFLISTVLRGEWGFSGLVMSDWNGTYSITESIRAGLDLEMPGPTVVRGAALNAAFRSRKVSEQNIDDRVRNVLNLINNVQPSGVPEDAPEKSNDDPEVKKILREAASSAIVLLKNEANVLPLDPSVINPSVSSAQTQRMRLSLVGAPQHFVVASYTVTPFDAIAEAAKELGINEVQYAHGGTAHKYAPVIGPELRAADGTAGVDLTFFNEDPWVNSQVNPVFHMVSTTTDMFMIDNLSSEIISSRYWLEASGKFTPETTSEASLSLPAVSKYNYPSRAVRIRVSAIGKADLYIDGRRIVDNSTNVQLETLSLGRTYSTMVPTWRTSKTNLVISGSKERLGSTKLEAGQSYNLLVRYTYDLAFASSTGTTATLRGGALRFGVSPRKTVEEFLAEAVSVARQVDAVILLVGLNSDFESESSDRPHMRLPSYSDEWTTAVLAANRNTVVVVQSGTPVEMPWVDKAASLLQAFYGGNEVGHGISDVVFGKVNPSGRLPLSFPIRLEDNPTSLNFGGRNVYYGEGIFVGYRHYEALKKKALFPFGFGKSYTTFDYSDASVSATKFGPKDTVIVSVKVTNTGPRAGREVVQVYVHDVVSTLQRPPKELRGFTKTAVLQPGESENVSIGLDHLAFGFFNDRRV